MQQKALLGEIIYSDYDDMKQKFFVRNHIFRFFISFPNKMLKFKMQQKASLGEIIQSHYDAKNKSSF